MAKVLHFWGNFVFPFLSAVDDKYLFVEEENFFMTTFEFWVFLTVIWNSKRNAYLKLEKF